VEGQQEKTDTRLNTTKHLTRVSDASLGEGKLAQQKEEKTNAPHTQKNKNPRRDPQEIRKTLEDGSPTTEGDED